jgi:tetratricopeptide (TPR) repeat protein
VITRDRIRLRLYQRQAEGYLEIGLPQHALEVLNRLGDRVLRSPHALYLQGEALRSLGRFTEALGPLGQAAQAVPENVHVQLALGWCHKRTARLDLAIQDLERALDVEPTDALVHYNLACYLSLAGQRHRALVHLSRALSLDATLRRLVDNEPDFNSLRADPEFLSLVEMAV